MSVSAANNYASENGKKKDIAELIRLIALQPEQLEPNVPLFVQQMIAKAVKIAKTEEVTSIVNQSIRNNIGKLIVPFDETFTHDEIMLLISFYKEIKLLVSFYKSDAMMKFSKNSRKLFDPIYEAYRQVLNEVLGTCLGDSKCHSQSEKT